MVKLRSRSPIFTIILPRGDAVSIIGSAISVQLSSYPDLAASPLAALQRA